MDPFLQEYLERLDAMLDVHTNATRSLTEKVDALVVAWRTDLEKRSSHTAVVDDPPAPTPALETTTGASAPVLDVSCSTTKAQEVLEVIHDAPPACIAMAHITCSTDGSHQVVATNSVNKVTTVYPESVADLSDKEVRHTTTTIGPEPSVDLHNTIPILPTEEAGTQEENQDVAAATQAVNITVGDKFVGAIYTSVPAGISMLPLVHASSTKVHKALDALYVASTDCIAKTPVTYSTDCVNQVIATSSLALPITPTSPFRNHDLDVSPPTRHEGLPIWPTPWPSFLVHHTAEGNEVRPTPWPSFSCSHEEDTADSDFSVQLFGPVKEMGVLST